MAYKLSKCDKLNPNVLKLFLYFSNFPGRRIEWRIWRTFQWCITWLMLTFKLFGRLALPKRPPQNQNRLVLVFFTKSSYLPRVFFLGHTVYSINKKSRFCKSFAAVWTSLAPFKTIAWYKSVLLRKFSIPQSTPFGSHKKTLSSKKCTPKPRDLIAQKGYFPIFIVHMHP